MQVASDAKAAGYRVSDGSFGWDGAFGTHFWVDPKEKVVGILMIQTNNPNRELDRDFENAVMQAMVEQGSPSAAHLKNGDRVTGSIVKKDGKTRTIKTDQFRVGSITAQATCASQKPPRCALMGKDLILPN
jgi:hypothetical protein